MKEPITIPTIAQTAPTSGSMVLLMTALIIGSAIVVMNMDDIYIGDKNGATVSMPDNYRAGSGGSLILQASDADGEPAANEDVKISMTRDGKTYPLWKGSTNDDGIAQPSFEVPDIVGEANITIEVGSETFVREVDVVSSYSIIISTDKPLYQPGQIIHLRTLAYKGQPAVATEEDILLEVKDPNGNKIFKKTLEANEFGIAAYDFALSDQLPLGNYRIIASIGETTSKRTVSVQRYVLPKYRIQFEDVDSWYVVADTITGKLNASYIFGEPITGDVEINARTYYGDWVTIKSFQGTLENGLFDFSLPLSGEYFVGLDINQGNAYLELNATITDTSGHVEEKSLMVTITESPISLMSIGDTNIHGKESTYYFIARYPDGKAVEDATLFIKINGYNFEHITNTQYTLHTDDRGVAALTFTYDTGIYSINVEAQKGSQSSLTYYVNLHGSDGGIKILSDQGAYDIGDTATCNVYYSSPQDATSQNGNSGPDPDTDKDAGDEGTPEASDTTGTNNGGTTNVFYDILAGGFVVQTGHTELENGEAIIDFIVTNDMVPMVECRVYKIQSDFTIETDSIILNVGQEEPLDVTITSDKETYKPGEDVSVYFKVTDESDLGIASALGVTIVDLSVYELQDRFTGYEDIYFSLESEFTNPQYQILSYVYGVDNTLPSETTTHVDKSEVNLGVSVYQSGIYHSKNADDFEEESTSKFLEFIMVVAVLGYLSLFFLAAKFKLSRGTFLSLIIAMSILLPVGFLTSDQFSDEETDKDNSLQEVGGEDFEDAGFAGGGFWGREVWDDMAEFDGDGGIEAPQAANGGEKQSGGDSESNEKKTVTEPDHIRKEFPETWVWEPTLITNEFGVASLGLIAPDTITTWRIDALASTKDAKLGFGTGNITVFQEFFVEPDIPVEVVRNDEFPLNIMVYNYLAEEQEITIKLDAEDWFDLLAGDPDDSDNPEQPDDPDDYFQVVTVDPSSVVGVEYMIKARDVGTHNVTITGSSNLVPETADKVVRPMDVVPDGQVVQHILNGEITDDTSIDETIQLSLDRIENSENAYLVLQGSMEAVAVEGAEQYIRFVSGCGEQSMSTLSIDVLAYSMVKDTGASEKLFEYETICTQGIQHELTFLMSAKNGEGRGIVWFPSDDDVHPWLTSWGLLTFQDAINAGFQIDDSIITDMQDYLISQQNEDGSFSFPERGLYEYTNPILRAKVVSTTAYITRALLYSGYPIDSHIKDAIGYIEDNIQDNWDDAYTLALSLITLVDGNGGSSVRSEIAGRLLELKQEENGTYFWSSDTNMISNSEPRWWGGTSINIIETTSYAIMGLAKHGDKDAATRGVKYLLSHRIGGGFFSTQDTVVAFQALTSWGEVSIDELTVDIAMNGVDVESKLINEDNSDLTHLIDLRPYLEDENSISLVSTGSGTLLYQIYIEEYIPWEEQPTDGDLELTVEYDSTNISVSDSILATLTVGYSGSGPQLKMVLVDLRAPVGFSFNAIDFEILVEGGVISHYELNGRQVNLYLTDLVSGEEYDLTYRLTAEKPIRASLQGINAYDMYNTMLKDTLDPVEIVSHI